MLLFFFAMSVKLLEIMHVTVLRRRIVLFIYIEFMMGTVFFINSTTSINHILHITAMSCDTSNILITCAI